MSDNDVFDSCCSDCGVHDRVVIQEVIKNLASTARLGSDNTSAKRFKGMNQ